MPKFRKGYKMAIKNYRTLEEVEHDRLHSFRYCHSCRESIQVKFSTKSETICDECHANNEGTTQ